jgi:hypothetical protein
MTEVQKKEPSIVEATRLVNLEGTRLEGRALRGFPPAMERGRPRGLRGVGTHPRDEFVGFAGTGDRKIRHCLSGDVESSI